MALGLDKVFTTPLEAIADIPSGASLAVGGFGLSGIPSSLIQALLQRGIDNLRIVSNNCGVDDWGLGLLLAQRRVAKMTSSYVGENKEFARQYLSGEIEVELIPQGTLAERLRAGGCGIPAFYTATGVGTGVSEGGIPWRYNDAGEPVLTSPPKETRFFDVLGRENEYVMETGIVCDYALVRAWKGDRNGNLIYRYGARNFNPLCAMAGRITIAEVENLVEPGELDPGVVDTASIFVQRVVIVDADDEKRIERRTTRGPRG